jgi:hypothetical protein
VVPPLPKFGTVDIQWTELKLLEKYAMPMVPHLDHFLSDFYHCLAFFWSVERGLFRSKDPERHAIVNFVFPDLHNLNDSGITKKVTAVIRENLPPKVAHRTWWTLIQQNQPGEDPLPSSRVTVIFKAWM